MEHFTLVVHETRQTACFYRLSYTKFELIEQEQQLNARYRSCQPTVLLRSQVTAGCPGVILL
jgi:hypothetical protein